MAVKYVKDFEFPAAAGFRDSAMPSKAGMSYKGMPSRAMPEKRAKGGSIKMDLPPKGSLIDKAKRVLADRGPVKPRAMPIMAVPDAGKPKSELGQRIDAIKARAVVNKAKVAANEQARKSAMEANAARKAARSAPPVAAAVPYVGMRKGGYTKKPSYGKGGLQKYAKGGKVKKLAGGGLSGIKPIGEKAAYERYQDRMYQQGLKATEKALAESMKSDTIMGTLKAAAKSPIGKIATRAIPGVGYGLAAYDIYNMINSSPSKKSSVTVEELPAPPQGKARGGKVAKVMREYKKGELHSGSKKGPLVKNPKQAIAIALSEERRMKKAMGGAVDNYAGKTGPYRGSPKKAKMLGRQDRRAREAMERAEKHAPGRSIDMPDRKAHGGMMRRKMA